MIIVYIDIILLVILLSLSLFTLFYCVYRVNRMRRNGQLTILLRPTKVVFSHKKDNDQPAELRTVVAYKNPFTGDYCVHKSREGRSYMNKMERCETDSADSGVSDAYEPVHESRPDKKLDIPSRPELGTNLEANSCNKTWNWNYKEYQI